MHFKGSNTIKSLLMVPKDKDPITKKSGIIYRYKCDKVECDDEYIEELSRTSPIYDHFNITGHNTNIDNFSIVGKEDQNLIRIRVNSPSLNKNIG